MKKLVYSITILFILQLAVITAYAAKSDCGPQPNKPPKVATQVAKEDPNVNNDYDKVIKENTQAGFVYLTMIKGAQPKPNACGLNPSNAASEWTGWGGPLDADNMTIGEGAGTRNDIIIGGTLFERGIGIHAVGKLVYPLTGADFGKFEGYVGMSDEKDPAECGAGGSSEFIFTVDGKQMFKSDVLKGTDAGKNVAAVKVAFDIPAGAKQLVIDITAGGDGNGCDHSALGDAKLIIRGTTSVEPYESLGATWGSIKKTY